MVALDDWDRLGRDVPCLVNLSPSGQYLMEDFYYAGGLPAVINELAFKAGGDPSPPQSPHLIAAPARDHARPAPRTTTRLGAHWQWWTVVVGVRV